MNCLFPQQIDKIKQAIRDGRFNPQKFASLNSQQARKEIADIVGSEEQAKEINLLLEKKLLLKNQELALYKFGEDILGLNKEQREATKQKIRDTYAKKKKAIEAPEGRYMSEIVADIYSKKYNTDVDLETADTIIKLSKEYKDAQAKLDAVKDENGRYKDKKDIDTLGIDAGAKQVAYEKYVEALKADTKKKTYYELSKNKPITGNLKAIMKNIRIFGIGGVFNFIAENSRALKATFDNSFVGRQARKAMRPGTFKEWWTMFSKSFSIIGNILSADFRDGNFQKLKTKQGLKNFFFGTITQAKAEALKDAQKAEIYSRENYQLGRYDAKDGKLDIGVREEEYPTSLPSRIPIFGKFLLAAETAYSLSAMRLRADIADNFYELAESKQSRFSEAMSKIPGLKAFAKEVVDLSDMKNVADINNVVNEMTGRGKIKGLSEEAQGFMNKVFFSAKFAKSQVDTLFSWAYFGRSKFARQQSAKNLFWVIATSYIVQGIFGMIDPDSFEEDLTSTDSGKVKFGNTRFDTTGGLGSYVTLISRMITNEMKSSTTGVKQTLGEDYGSDDSLEVFWNFIENKTSPIATIIKNLIKREDFEGRKPTGETILTDLTIPIVFETGYDAKEADGTAMMIIALLADGLGISANTYTYSGRWESSNAKWTDKFKKEKGEKSLERAGKTYDKMVNDKIIELRKDSEFMDKSDEDKIKELDKYKREIKKEVFKIYDFKE